ncbi:MAG: hypothetical protein US83_C0019G0003 [Candidatus Falkowbacteria bacterium GW2011_GWC2_38_22]|uniref:Antitoxin n=1 Tax=Candidatus Falkowbacteria bacterium GW2011_GWE1_38_31 TaxID=1618638 RepID=A0A0G0K1L9_9BACT|nr:MAG: hypothetical protein US73_C0017G0017 [Candidatus Falkowbacteria bacterium GW2011_GWF2_38_1205]KKQ60409.1 MAG: hypothetical protein US83_C0019G0003 [Candidatus Falkowbacteria bacterium GW2011_GWC2_38_22]KKQ62456.1 MAG: hypothetical protein US84_C0016G0003 [Candidatus Falkowbacteria bacterium GW2011_GWF1_38_22]KKQ64527.1 MAG: hypothetical protein US87_C0016G0003 [Candidatus Falkowbacteria bacterium GW2011_GWE2_38_254]KKQ69365.1 MAG: hypothetical protein US91_C0015G0003 [Candidatus Falkowb
MKYIELEKEEKKIETDFDAGKLKSTATKKDLANYQKYAQFTLEKTRNINIRLSEKDLLRIKAKAAEKGLPYQTLVSSVLHQYVNDK